MSGRRFDTRDPAPTLGGWQGRLGRFRLATPELIGSRELRRRTDTKFLMSPASAAEVLLALAADYAVLAAGSELVASYDTLYFDTPQLDFFHAHRRGRRVRHKARIRHYPDRRLTTLEVKTRKSELRTTKTSREHAFGNSELSGDDQAFVGGRTGIDRSVVPQVWTHFRRITLVGTITNERVTIDLDFHVEMGGHGRPFTDLAIVEVKQWPFSRDTPVMTALRAAGRRPGWASKYCAAIAFTRPDVPMNRLLPGIRALERGNA